MAIYAFAATLTLLCVGVWAFRPTEWTFSAQFRKLTSQLQGGRLDRLGEFVSDLPDEDPHGNFWRTLGGVTGLLHLLRDVRILSSTLTICVSERLVDRADAEVVWRYARKQVAYSLLAIFEAAICKFFTRLPHSAALQAVHFHWKASVRMATLLGAAGISSSSSLL